MVSSGKLSNGVDDNKDGAASNCLGNYYSRSVGMLVNCWWCRAGNNVGSRGKSENRFDDSNNGGTNVG